MSGALQLMGLMRKANAIAVGEMNTGSAVRGGKAKLLLLASDASDNARRRAETFAYGRSLPVVTLPFTKEQISDSVGLGGCSMATVTDMGLAAALMKKLADLSPEEYGQAADSVSAGWEREMKRRKKTASSERNKSKRRNSV